MTKDNWINNRSEMMKEKWKNPQFREHMIFVHEVPIETMFWRRVKKSDGDGCWNWEGSVHNSGYGQMQKRRLKKLAHRYSYEIHKGEIPKGKCVLHSCDNRLCVNPAHLFAGTHSDNRNDMYNKDRGRRTKPPHSNCISKDYLWEVLRGMENITVEIPRANGSEIVEKVAQNEKKDINLFDAAVIAIIFWSVLAFGLGILIGHIYF